VPLADWRDYLRWHWCVSRPVALQSVRERELSFQSALTGVKEQQPRWKRCLQTANFLMGDAIGQAYVQETFTPDARRRALDMVENLIAAWTTGCTRSSG